MTILRPGYNSKGFRLGGDHYCSYLDKENIIVNDRAICDVSDVRDLVNEKGEGNVDIIRACEMPRHVLEKMFKSSLINLESIPQMSGDRLRQFL